MIIIIPIGGIGKRFKNDFKKPKALIDIFDKPIISYLLDNLNIENIDYIFIPYNKEYADYRFEDFLIKQYPNINFRFYCLKNNTRGAAETINIGLNYLNEEQDKPVLCLDCDSFYLSDIISEWNGENSIFTFEDFSKKEIFSYIQINDANQIIDIKEKEKISNNACSGAYGFNSIKELKKYTYKIINENITQQSEFYTSGVIKEMIKNKIFFKNITIHKKEFIQLGIPTDVEKYCTDLIINKIKLNKGFIFDMDGHSNFDINIININNNYYLCKSSNCYEDSLRLHKQIEKQMNHHKLFKLNTPNIVYNSSIIDNKTYILMDYLNNSTICFNFIVNNNYSVLDKIFEFTIEIIERYIHCSTNKKIDKTIILDKIKNIKINLDKISDFDIDEIEFLNNKIIYLQNNCEEICNLKIPIGYCHGDLTLSNMLFDTVDNKIYLIDFLDSFIETPLFDIIKFRQDTKFFWSMNMTNLEMDKNKIKIALNYLDNKIENYFKKYDFFNSVAYNYFETINFLRILQYCKKKEIKKFIIDCLQT